MKLQLSALIFLGISSLASAGTLTISGTIDPRLQIESISSVYQRDNLCEGTFTKGGSVKQKNGKFSAKISWKDGIGGFQVCSHYASRVEMKVSQSWKELGRSYKKTFEIYYDISGTKALDVTGDKANCGIEVTSMYEHCRFPGRKLGAASNKISDMKIGTVPWPAPVIGDENIEETFEVKDWGMAFVLYKMANGPAANGAMVRVLGNSNKLPDGYYRIEELERNHKGGVDTISVDFLDASGAKRYFEFSPDGPVNSFYSDCVNGRNMGLIVKDKRYDYNRKKEYCAVQ